MLSDENLEIFNRFEGDDIFGLAEIDIGSRVRTDGREGQAAWRLRGFRIGLRRFAAACHEDDHQQAK